MFKVFRFILILLSLVAAVLLIFALTGSYANKSYLTPTYMFNFHLNQVDLTKLIDSSGFSKRELPTKSKRDWASQIIDATGGGSSSSSSSSSSLSDEVSLILSQVLLLDYSDLGLSEVYQVGYWGYCRGSEGGDSDSDKFNNKKNNFTWCSKPKAGYKFDPLEVLKAELNNSLLDSSLSSVVQEGLTYLVENLSYDTLDLPGDLKGDIKTLNNLITASFGLVMAGAVMAIISVVVQLLGCFMSPHSCCLSFLNFLYQCLIVIILFVGAVLVTASSMIVKKKINDNTDTYGIKTFLSTNFYAFLWCSVVAGIVLIIFSLLGHCCGLFSTGRRKFRSMTHGEPEMAYSHESGLDEEMSLKSHHDHESHH